MPPAEKEDRPWDVPLVGLRAVATIRAALKAAHCWLAGLPLGPFGVAGTDERHGEAGMKNAVTACETWAADITSNGGGCKLTRRGGVEYAKDKGKMGARVVLQCSNAGMSSQDASTMNAQRQRAESTKCNCPFALQLEESAEGWIVSNMLKASYEAPHWHNHEQLKTRAEANAAGGMAQIPPDLEAMAKVLANGNAKPAFIYKMIAHECVSREIDVTFTKSDIANAFASTAEERELDATRLLEQLLGRKARSGLHFNYALDESNCLDRVFWEVPGVSCMKKFTKKTTKKNQTTKKAHPQKKKKTFLPRALVPAHLHPPPQTPHSAGRWSTRALAHERRKSCCLRHETWHAALRAQTRAARDTRPQRHDAHPRRVARDKRGHSVLLVGVRRV